MSIDIASY